MTAPNNMALLDKVNTANAWTHAKKVQPVWARCVQESQVVETIEGTESVEPGDFLCRGVAGELWPQTAESLRRKYTATEEVDSDGWRKYTPDPEIKGVMAAQVDHPFQVHATWGTLSGKAGDYLIKNYDAKDKTYPEDVWIVDQALFQATYEHIGVH